MKSLINFYRHNVNIILPLQRLFETLFNILIVERPLLLNAKNCYEDFIETEVPVYNHLIFTEKTISA